MATMAIDFQNVVYAVCKMEICNDVEGFIWMFWSKSNFLCLLDVVLSVIA